MKTLQADKGGKFISIKPKEYYKKQKIIIKYTTLYLYEKNNLAKCG